MQIYGVEYWERHLERLKMGCDKIKLPMPSKALLNSYKNKILKKSLESEINRGVLKIIITRGVGGRGYKYESNLKPTIIFLSFPAKLLIKNFIILELKLNYVKLIF